MRILIMGAGAIGSAVGGFMAKAGHDVTLVGRERAMQAIGQNGLRITGIWGDHHVANLRTFTNPGAYTGNPLDLICVTVKSYDTPAAAKSIAPLISENTLVAAYQNGLGNAEALAKTAGWNRVIGVRAIYGVRTIEPAHVDVTVIAQPTALGVYSDNAPADRVRDVAQAMDDAGLPTVYTDAIETVLWGKVAYNCALNPMSALLDVPYGALAETEHTRAIMRGVVNEFYAVGAERGVALKPATANEYYETLLNDLIPPTAVHYASMREDLVYGRRTEIDALNGAITRYGQDLGIDTPANALLTRLIKAREEFAER